MTSTIAYTRAASNSEWDEIWSRCPYSTFFHSRAWAEIWADYSVGKVVPQAVIIAFDDNRSALLPISIEQKMCGLVKIASCSPAGTFGGWISSEELSTKQNELLAEFLLEKYPDLTWRLSPYNIPLLDTLVPNATPDVTRAIDLRIGFDPIVRRWTKGHASGAKKALRAGVTVMLADSELCWREYFDIYLDSLRRWDERASSKYEWELFRLLYEKKSNNVKLWLAMYLGKPVAGALCLYSPRHVVYWHGAALEEHFSLRAVNYLLYEVIRDACNQPLWWFDFNPSGGHQGVEKFKKSFGAKELSSPIFSRMSSKAKLGVKISSIVRRYRKICAMPNKNTSSRI